MKNILNFAVVLFLAAAIVAAVIVAATAADMTQPVSAQAAETAAPEQRYYAIKPVDMGLTEGGQSVTCYVLFNDTGASGISCVTE